MELRNNFKNFKTFLRSNKNHAHQKHALENNKEKDVDLWNALKVNGLIVRATKGFKAPGNLTGKTIIAKQDFCVMAPNGVTRAPRKR